MTEKCDLEAPLANEYEFGDTRTDNSSSLWISLFGSRLFVFLPLLNIISFKRQYKIIVQYIAISPPPARIGRARYRVREETVRPSSSSYPCASHRRYFLYWLAVGQK